jgi:hypothetical protein
MVDVELRSSGLRTTTKALIDTGAPRCVFPRGIGDLLAVEFPEFGGQKKIKLMGHDWPAVTETVELVLRPFDDPWEAEVDFVVEDELPFALLGYEGFLNRWAVSFNGYLGYFIVEPIQDFDERQPPEVFDTLREQWPHLFLK